MIAIVFTVHLPGYQGRPLNGLPAAASGYARTSGIYPWSGIMTVMRVPHRPAACRVERARVRMREELTTLAAIEHELSVRPGTPPEHRSEYWLGIISGTAAYLLWALDAEDAACGRISG